MAHFRVAPETILNIKGVNHHEGAEIELNAKDRRKFRNLIALGALVPVDAQPEPEAPAQPEADEEPADGDDV